MPVDRKSGETLATAEVVTVSKGQRATCRFNPLAGGIPAGSYWLVVTTFGLVGESTPRVFRKPVTLTEAIPEPELPRVDSAGAEDRPGEIVRGENFLILGEGLSAYDSLAGDRVKVKWTEGGTPKELITDTVEQWDTRMLFPTPSELAETPADTDLTVEVTFGTIVRSCTAKLVDE